MGLTVGQAQRLRGGRGAGLAGEGLADSLIEDQELERLQNRGRPRVGIDHRGYYAAADGNVRSKGTMYLVLHAQGDYAHGRWVGLSYDGPVVSGYATLARSQEEAKSVMDRVIEEAA